MAGRTWNFTEGFSHKVRMIDNHQWLVSTIASGVDIPCESFFSKTRLSDNHDICIQFRYAAKAIHRIGERDTTSGIWACAVE